MGGRTLFLPQYVTGTDRVPRPNIVGTSLDFDNTIRNTPANGRLWDCSSGSSLFFLPRFSKKTIIGWLTHDLLIALL